MVALDRLVAMECELPVSLLPVERLGLLLCYPDEDHPLPYLPLPAELVGDVILPLFVWELVNRDFLPLPLSLHGLPEALRNLAQDHRGRNRLLQLAAPEPHQPATGCQLTDIPVEVETIQALHFQCDVPVQKFREEV